MLVRGPLGWKLVQVRCVALGCFGAQGVPSAVVAAAGAPLVAMPRWLSKGEGVFVATRTRVACQHCTCSPPSAALPSLHLLHGSAGKLASSPRAGAASAGAPPPASAPPRRTHVPQLRKLKEEDRDLLLKRVYAEPDDEQLGFLNKIIGRMARQVAPGTAAPPVVQAVQRGGEQGLTPRAPGCKQGPTHRSCARES